MNQETIFFICGRCKILIEGKPYYLDDIPVCNLCFDHYLNLIDID